MNVSKQETLMKGAIISGISNFLINAVIQYTILREEEYVAISVDSISSNTYNVVGSSITLAIALAIIMTVINYINIKEPKVPFFPKALWLVIKHAFFTFTTLTAFGVLWQRKMGSIEIELLPAVLIIGLIAGLVSGIINYVTLKECMLTDPDSQGFTPYPGKP